MASQCGADSTKFLQWHSSVGLFQLSFSSGVPVYPASIRWVVQRYSSLHWVNQWHSSGITVYTGPANVHWLRVRVPSILSVHILSQCTLAGPVYTGMPLECNWLNQCKREYYWATQRILAGYTGTPLEKLSWNSPTLECHWRNLVESAPHWEATGETLTFVAYTRTPLEGLWQPTHAPTHIVKHAE